MFGNRTKLDKNLFTIGGNREAVIVCGVNVLRNTVLVYIIAGLLYGFAGSLKVARTGNATSGLVQGYELGAIASCVVGSVLMRDSVGSIYGIIVGALLFQVINYGLVYIGVSPYIQYIVNVRLFWSPRSIFRNTRRKSRIVTIKVAFLNMVKLFPECMQQLHTFRE